MNYISNTYPYEFKYKYYIISKIKKITNQCKNGCKIYLNNKNIIIKAFNNNTVLLAYELIKKELKLLDNKEIKNDNIEIKQEITNKFDVLENDNIVDYIIKNENIPNTKVYNIENTIKKEEHIYKILNNSNVSEEEQKSNKIALELLKEEEAIINKKNKKKRNKQRRKENMKNLIKIE